MENNTNRIVTVAELIDRVKELIQDKCDGKVRQIDVAIWLQIDHILLATLKKRNSMPFANVLSFCKDIGADPFQLLYVCNQNTKVAA